MQLQRDGVKSLLLALQISCFENHLTPADQLFVLKITYPMHISCLFYKSPCPCRSPMQYSCMVQNNQLICICCLIGKETAGLHRLCNLQKNTADLHRLGDLLNKQLI